MLKSWKVRGLAVGAAAIMASMTLSSPGFAQVAPPDPPTVVSITPANGPAGTAAVVRGTGCGTPTVPATSATLILRGPTITDPAGVRSSATPVAGSSGGDFAGSVTIPAGARAADVFTVTATCTNAGGTSGESTTSATFTVLAGTLVGGATTATLTGVTTLTGTSGTTTATTGTTGTTGTTTGTTGVPVPIVQQPTFTG